MKLNDVIKEAEYADIILSLLMEPYRINSVTKMIFFALILSLSVFNNITVFNDCFNCFSIAVICFMR